MPLSVRQADFERLDFQGRNAPKPLRTSSSLRTSAITLLYGGIRSG